MAAVMQPCGIKLVDIGRTPRPSDVGACIPSVGELIMGGQTAGEITVHFEVFVVLITFQAGISIHIHRPEIVAHAQGALKTSDFCLMQEETSYGEGCIVRDKSRLFSTRIIVVRLISA